MGPFGTFTVYNTIRQYSICLAIVILRYKTTNKSTLGFTKICSFAPTIPTELMWSKDLLLTVAHYHCTQCSGSISLHAREVSQPLIIMQEAWTG